MKMSLKLEYSLLNVFLTRSILELILTEDRYLLCCDAAVVH